MKYTLFLAKYSPIINPLPLFFLQLPCRFLKGNSTQLSERKFHSVVQGMDRRRGRKDSILIVETVEKIPPSMVAWELLFGKSRNEISPSRKEKRRASQRENFSRREERAKGTGGGLSIGETTRASFSVETFDSVGKRTKMQPSSSPLLFLHRCLAMRWKVFIVTPLSSRADSWSFFRQQRPAQTEEVEPYRE